MYWLPQIESLNVLRRAERLSASWFALWILHPGVRARSSLARRERLASRFRLRNGLKLTARAAPCPKGIVICDLRQRLRGRKEFQPRIGLGSRREPGVELGECSVCPKLHHRRGDCVQCVAKFLHPRQEIHSAPSAYFVLVGPIGFIYEVGHSSLGPRRRGCEVRQRIGAYDGGTPARQSFSGADTAEVAAHRTFTQLGLKQRGYSAGVAE